MKKNNLVHNLDIGIISAIREVIFGLEDGMISTLGVLIGVAVGTNNHFVIVLSGFVVIMVESISMGVGSYLSNKAVREVGGNKLREEHREISESPEEEKKELVGMYVKDGWPENLAREMAQTASEKKSLFLKEMAYRELFVHPERAEKLARGGVFMFLSYIIGGSIPLSAYVFLPSSTAMPVSVIVTFIGLFILGATATRFTKRRWWKAGLEMFFIAGVAALVGYFIGSAADQFISR